MAVKLPGGPSLHGIARDGMYNIVQNTLDVPQQCRSNWYLSRKEIEDHSPSRKDGIDLKKETQLRKLYCSFIQDLGMKLKVPQVTIATAMMFCHRFFLRQSHARNEWQTIATVSMFLAGKVEEAPRLLMDVVVVAYETMYRRDPTAAQRIKQKEIYEKQKELILIGERLLLQTIGFDLNIQHPYKPLVAALKKFKISHKELAKMAWNFVNDWLRTTLCLQYKPHYIAAGSLFLAAKYYKVKLPSERGIVWWQEFDVTPRQLEEVIQQMFYYLEQNRKSVAPCAREKVILTPLLSQKAASTSPHSCVLSGSANASNSSHVVDREVGAKIQPIEKSLSPEKVDSHCQVSDSGSTNSVIEDGERCGEVEEQATESDQISGSKIVTVCVGLSEVDKDRIKATLKRRRWERALTKRRVVGMDQGEDGEAWIERELEMGIELGVESAEKKTQRLV